MKVQEHPVFIPMHYSTMKAKLLKKLLNSTARNYEHKRTHNAFWEHKKTNLVLKAQIFSGLFFG